ncbi:hypothetical protein [Microbulbifer sp. ZKSA002]|uniref:hypothetical protein n=1 Tax=Microbulbifer sp. ZKSA002 TaxID=3243388 RepID=UPI00403A1742
MSGSHGDKPVYLPAGASINVQASGDFIFLRSADYPVRVILKSDPVTMEAGEKRRLDRDFEAPEMPAFTEFDVENTADVDQVVTFVVGMGDYDKVIIAGEVNISPYVNTVSGSSATLPMEVRKIVSLESSEQWSAMEGAEYVAYSLPDDPDNNECSITGACAWFEGAAYYITYKGLYKFEVGEGLIEPPASPATSYDKFIPWVDDSGNSIELDHDDGSHDDFNHGDGYGIHGGYISSSGEIYFLANGKLYRSHLSSTVLYCADQYIDTRSNYYVPNFAPHFGAGAIGANYYAVMHELDDGGGYDVEADKTLVVLNTVNNEISYLNLGKLTLGSSDNAQIQNAFVTPDGYIAIGCDFEDSSDWGFVVIDPNSGKEINDYKFSRLNKYENPDYEYWPVNHVSEYDDLRFSEDGYIRIGLKNSEFIAVLADHVTSYALFSIRDIDDSDGSTKQYYNLSTWRSLLPYASGTRLHGGIIEIILGALTGKTPASDYLDYVTKLENDNGKYRVEYNTGTNTFLRQGLTDGYISYLESEFAIEVLPEYFD